jgi:hypothetical protein
MLQPDLLAIGPRRRAPVLAEEAVEVGRVAKAEAVADLLDRKVELLQSRTGFAGQPLVDDRARATALPELAVLAFPNLRSAQILWDFTVAAKSREIELRKSRRKRAI